MAEALNEERREVPLGRGERVAGYEVVRLIGRGGMSEVYEAIQMGTGRSIALKLIGGRRGEDTRYIERLRREGYALGRIRHPNVVDVYDAGVIDGRAWISMELLEGESLRELLLRGDRLSVADAVDYAAAVCEGLEAAHRLGIVHRDMKPENVYLTANGGVKILDFGNAKLENAGLKRTDPHRVFGTAAYMSPEQLGFQSTVGARSDLYAVGLLLYESLRGRHPFASGPRPEDLPPSAELCRMQIEEVPPPLSAVEPEVPVALSELVEHLTAKDHARRPSAAALVSRELYAIRETLSTKRSGAVARASSRPARGRSSDPALQPEFSRSIKATPRPSMRPTTAMAIAVGAIAGTLLFAIVSVSRLGASPPPRQVAAGAPSAAPAPASESTVPSASSETHLAAQSATTHPSSTSKPSPPSPSSNSGASKLAVAAAAAPVAAERPSPIGSSSRPRPAHGRAIPSHPEPEKLAKPAATLPAKVTSTASRPRSTEADSYAPIY